MSNAREKLAWWRCNDRPAPKLTQVDIFILLASRHSSQCTELGEDDVTNAVLSIISSQWCVLCTVLSSPGIIILITSKTRNRHKIGQRYQEGKQQGCGYSMAVIEHVFDRMEDIIRGLNWNNGVVIFPSLIVVLQELKHLGRQD